MPRENERDKLARMTVRERALWAEGLRVAGIDEVGRGPLAGPVVAACVIIPADKLITGVDDSKKLSEARREALYGLIMDAAEYAEFGWVEPEMIDEINILNATRLAMERAARGATGAFFIVDALEGLALPGTSRAVVHGDAEVYMIAAASVVAKVERDRYMVKLAEAYPCYGFERNKGYGTAEHIRAIIEHGPCPAHRRSFIKKWTSAL